jgi:ribosomal protein S13
MDGPAHARRVRRRRAIALRNIQTTFELRAALEDVPDALRGVPVHLVMCACPGVGPVTCKHILKRADVWPLLKLGDLTDIELVKIIELIP